MKMMAVFVYQQQLLQNKTGGGVIPFGNSNQNGLADDVYSYRLQMQQ